MQGRKMGGARATVGGGEGREGREEGGVGIKPSHALAVARAAVDAQRRRGGQKEARLVGGG